MKLHEIVIHKTIKLCFSSKQAFEEKSITEHVIIEIFYPDVLFDLLMCLLTIIEPLQDFNDKTLDLTRPKNPKNDFCRCKDRKSL